MSDAQIQWAIGELLPNAKRLKAYEAYEQYYMGIQPLAFATDKYRTQFWALFRGFADNMCQSVVDVQAERLEICGFTSSAAEVEEEKLGTENPDDPEDVKGFPGVVVSVVDDPLGDEAWDEWEDNSMDIVADQVHADAFLYGDAFVIADGTGVWRQSPYQVAVRYSEDRPGEIDLAAKMWKTLDKTIRLNIYVADDTGATVLTRYVTDVKQDKGTGVKLQDFHSMDNESEFSKMPVIHFSNKRRGGYGISELLPVIPLQNALNKASMDLIIAMEYQAFQQRWIAGADISIDPDTGQPKEFVGRHGPGNYLALPDPEAKVGSFDATSLAPYVKVITDLRAQIARVSGVPPHYFFSDGGATVSGEALKVGEIRFERKGKRQQRTFGHVWEKLMHLVVSDDSIANEDDDEPTEHIDPSNHDINAIWAEVSPRSESEEMDVLLKKQAIGVPNSQLQKEAGYDPDQVVQFAVELAEQIKLGLVPDPANPGGKPATKAPVQVPVGESSASTASGKQMGVEPAAAPPSNA